MLQVPHSGFDEMEVEALGSFCEYYVMLEYASAFAIINGRLLFQYELSSTSLIASIQIGTYTLFWLPYSFNRFKRERQ